MSALRQRLSIRYGPWRGKGKVFALILPLFVAVPVSADEVVIAALGDSLTQGYGLPAEDGFVPQLQGWLRARGHDVVIINAGVSGDTTAGGLARVNWTLTPDVDAMIVALGGNDLLRGLAPEISRANLDGILQTAGTADVEILLVGLRAFSNYGTEYQLAFNAIYPDLATQYGTLLFADFLGVVSGTDAEGRQGLAIRYFQRDGIHPNADGVALIVETIGPDVEMLIGLVSPP